jgi:hypothetical protein
MAAEELLDRRNEIVNQDAYMLTIRSSAKGEEWYNMRVTKAGWYVSHHLINGESEKGTPFVYRNPDRDCISYPSQFPWIIY